MVDETFWGEVLNVIGHLRNLGGDLCVGSLVDLIIRRE